MGKLQPTQPPKRPSVVAQPRRLARLPAALVAATAATGLYVALSSNWNFFSPAPLGALALTEEDLEHMQMETAVTQFIQENGMPALEKRFQTMISSLTTEEKSQYVGRLDLFRPNHSNSGKEKLISRRSKVQTENEHIFELTQTRLETVLTYYLKHQKSHGLHIDLEKLEDIIKFYLTS